MSKSHPAPQGDVVRDYLKRFPSASSHYLSEMIFREVPGLFPSQDAARSRIRYYRGAHGNQNRSVLLPESYAPIVIPESVPEAFGYFQLSISDFPAVLGGDAHIPYHDQDALELFIEHAQDIKAKTIILLGDWLDCYQLSRFNRDPRMRSIHDEIDTFAEVYAIMRKACPKARIVFKFGNHEERYDHYITRCAPELFNLPEIRLETIIRQRCPGIEIVKDKQVIKAGHLNIIHGHEYAVTMFNPVNPARGLYLRAKTSAICAHYHQSSDHTESSIDGQISACWSTGCLCGLHPPYMPLNKWNLGMIDVEMDEEMFSVRNRKIVNYRIV